MLSDTVEFEIGLRNEQSQKKPIFLITYIVQWTSSHSSQVLPREHGFVLCFQHMRYLLFLKLGYKKQI